MWCVRKMAEAKEERANRREQRRINKMIEKQLKKEKREYRSTHRLQIVGLEGSGKSTLIQQMRLHADDFDFERRRQVGAEIRAAVKQAMRALVTTLETEGDAQGLEEDIEVVKTADDEDEDFFKSAMRLWSCDRVKSCLGEMLADGRTSEELSSHHDFLDSAKYFFDNLERVGCLFYVPTDADVLRQYTPTHSVLEAKIKMDNITFCLFEVNRGNDSHYYKWIQYAASDVIAVVFVVDLSAYDVLVYSGSGASATMSIKRQNSGTQFKYTKMRDAIALFTSVWNNPLIRQKSVILLLNKLDRLEEKVMAETSKMSEFFPEYRTYKITCPQALDELKHGASWRLVKAKYFLRDCFLEIAAHKQNSNHQCYHYFTSATNVGDVI